MEKKIKVGDRVKVNMPIYREDYDPDYDDVEWEEFTGEVTEIRPFAYIVKRDYIENSFVTCKASFIEVLSRKQIFKEPHERNTPSWFGEALLKALKSGENET